MMFVNALVARPRLLASLAVMTALGVFLPNGFSLSSRLLVAWDAGTALYLVLTFIMMSRSNPGSMRRRAPSQDEGATFILIIVALATLASLGAIMVELYGVGRAGPAHQPLRIALAIATILCSWLFVHTSFSLHYAHEYYGEGSDRRMAGMRFPSDDEPDYWDFLYFAANIGAAAQTSDVVITSRSVRRLVLAHTILSFFYNTTILALAVNVGAGMT